MPLRALLAGSAVCPEDEAAAAASAINKFLAEFVARARKFNKSHKCFTADQQAYKNSEHVDDAFKNGLKGWTLMHRYWQYHSHIPSLSVFQMLKRPGSKCQSIHHTCICKCCES